MKWLEISKTFGGVLEKPIKIYILLLFYRLNKNFMKKLISLAFITGLLFLFGCAKNWPTTIDIPTDASGTVTTVDTTTGQNTDERQTYESKTDRFTLQFPTTRTLQEDIYGASVVFFSPLSAGDTLKENVGIVKSSLKKDYTLDEYYLSNKEILAVQSGYTEIESTNIKVNDLDAKKSIFKTSMNGTNLEFEQVIIIKGKFAYIITYTATEATFSQYVQKVDEMVATLEIK